MSLVTIHQVILAMIALGNSVGGCLENPTRTASYYNVEDNIEIKIELYHSHPYLAEYDRVVVFGSKQGVLDARELPPDTGGYAAANLYRCGKGSYLLDGYATNESILVPGAQFSDAPCLLPGNYLGRFEGGGSDPWRFCPAEQCQERKLEMQGG